MRRAALGIGIVVLAWATFTTGASAESGSGDSPRAAEGSAVLYDQINNVSTQEQISQDYTDTHPDFADDDNQAADDFTVPAGQSWTIDSVEVAGVYDGEPCGSPAGPAQAVNVFFYADAGGLPGTEIASRLGLAPNAGPNFLVSFPNLTLVPGTYWVSVQAVQSCISAGEWFWFQRTVQSGNLYVWRNPGGGFFGGACQSYSNSGSCAGPDPDLAFRLSGNSYACKGFYATQAGQAMPSDRAYASLVGTAGGDTLIGTGASDVVVALTGKDTVKTKGGVDVICGGPGNDRLYSGGGDDGVWGQGGKDFIKLGGGDDVVNAGGGKDFCLGGAGDDAGRCEGGRP